MGVTRHGSHVRAAQRALPRANLAVQAQHVAPPRIRGEEGGDALGGAQRRREEHQDARVVRRRRRGRRRRGGDEATGGRRAGDRPDRASARAGPANARVSGVMSALAGSMRVFSLFAFRFSHFGKRFSASQRHENGPAFERDWLPVVRNLKNCSQVLRRRLKAQTDSCVFQIPQARDAGRQRRASCPRESPSTPRRARGCRRDTRTRRRPIARSEISSESTTGRADATGWGRARRPTGFVDRPARARRRAPSGASTSARARTIASGPSPRPRRRAARRPATRTRC